jgi:hypothetical protein
MTDLTLGLALAGGLLVAGVLLYNWLQERSLRRRAERAFGSTHSDVLLEERREPTLANSGTEPELQRRAAPRVDYAIELELPASVEPALAKAWLPVAQRFPRRAFLLQAAPGTWQAALQLVSRAGVVAEPELIEFRSALESLAAGLGGSARSPGMREALQAARELDAACIQADIQVALHVIGVAPEQDFTGQPFQAAPRADGVTLTLDVARTADPERGYEAMARAGQALARAWGARLVDDEGRDLDERALAAVRSQVEAVRALLAGRGIEPGSPLALRLFS